MKWTDTILNGTIVPLIPKFVRPNHITLLRICLTPLVGWLLYIENFFAGGVLFAFLVLTDGIDGTLARSRNMISTWGKLYDPLADKLLIGISALVLVTRYISAWLAGAIILIETILLASGARRSFASHTNIQANKWGKYKMIFQSVGIICIILGAMLNIPFYIAAAAYILYTALVLALVSLFKYSSR